MSNYPVCSCCGHDDDWICASCNELTELAALLERLAHYATHTRAAGMWMKAETCAQEERDALEARALVKRLRGDDD